MKSALQVGIGTLMLAAFHAAAGQAAGVAAQEPAAVVVPASTAAASGGVSAESVLGPAQRILDFRDADVKFALPDLMEVLRDRRHEGWVLAAYPDPKTGRPLIGAGFSLDLPEREHPQPDPLNPRPFIEPSSAELWQAAGLAPARLEGILQEYHEHLAAWGKKGFRKKIRTLAPEITDAEATALLRVAAVQAIINAQAYCRNFDELSASQQMGLSQLVYQMGVNLEGFGRFLNLINDGSREGAEVETTAGPEAMNWRTVQQSLMQSQWARLYRRRAVAVIAMLDPQYEGNPGMAERQIAVKLRPAVSHHRRHGRMASLRAASLNRSRGAAHSHARHHRSRHSTEKL